MKIAVFASGNGTTLQSIIDSINNKELDIEINLVVSDNNNAYALKRAKDNNIKTYVIKSTTKEAIDIELINILSHHDLDFIILAGYLKLIGPKLIDKYRIINTHPSLLPKFGGKGMYGMNVHKAVIDAKEEYSGATLHFIDNEYDKGNIIAQTKTKIIPSDTPETLAYRIQELEKKQLIETLKNFQNKKNNKTLILN